MKILLTNHSLEARAGSETWVMTMFDYLRKNHDVDVFTTDGRNNLINAGYDKKKRYDLALINHNSCLEILKSWDIETRIFTSHGIMTGFENPVRGADIYIAVSEEVKAYIKQSGYDSQIIRNPIDTDMFIETPVNKNLKNVLFLQNHAKTVPTTNKIINACEDYTLKILGGHQPTTVKNISWADLVITVGRGCYESLSCGKNVININTFGSDGIVTPENIFELRKYNCSGRYHNYQFEVDDIKTELKKYNHKNNMREYIKQHNNVDIIAQQYLSFKEQN